MSNIGGSMWDCTGIPNIAMVNQGPANQLPGRNPIPQSYDSTHVGGTTPIGNISNLCGGTYPGNLHPDLPMNATENIDCSHLVTHMICPIEAYNWHCPPPPEPTNFPPCQPHAYPTHSHGWAHYQAVLGRMSLPGPLVKPMCGECAPEPAWDNYLYPTGTLSY
ncbi:hypothetical protein BJ085DRAFT_31164 [Dimargaris cristalligena]|uniref:Uncharacterized protein n=1 Tax=Dimargaris cristalligena TaxID=215637 RepID=A0A4P9ZN02_9FUNG|nr:hypothetical protein BJ085DRAFT_31164 [Dimargaris cristalligena]|eukprot:RKP34525.1 hypothetical protein BJ085DRAFT_31164 [Dimargaris cristalligena]